MLDGMSRHESFFILKGINGESYTPYSYLNLNSHG